MRFAILGLPFATALAASLIAFWQAIGPGWLWVACGLNLLVPACMIAGADAARGPSRAFLLFAVTPFALTVPTASLTVELTVLAIHNPDFDANNDLASYTSHRDTILILAASMACGLAGSAVYRLYRRFSRP